MSEKTYIHIVMDAFKSGEGIDSVYLDKEEALKRMSCEDDSITDGMYIISIPVSDGAVDEKGYLLQDSEEYKAKRKTTEEKLLEDTKKWLEELNKKGS